MSFMEDYLFDEVVILGRGTPDFHGKFQFNGTARTVPARVVEKTGFLRRPFGKEHAFTHEVYLPPDDPVALQDRVTWNGTDYEVVDIASFDFIDGEPSHRRARIA